MDHRGQILWSVTAICAMLKTSCQTGKLYGNGDMENHSVGNFFLSDRRLDIIRYLQKVRRRFSLEGRSSQASSRAAPGMPEESGKETYSLQTLRNYTTWTRQKYPSKDSAQKKFSCRNKETHVHSLAQMVQQSWQVKTTKFGHPTDLDDIPNMEKDTAVHIKESGRSTPAEQQNALDDLEAWYDFWSILGNFSYHHHGQQRVKLHALPNSAQQIDVVKRTNTILGCFAGM